jgi:hypothetical protein
MESLAPDGESKDVAIPKPNMYLFGWPAIVEALEQQNDDGFQKRVRRLHKLHPSPIKFGGRGTAPTVEKRMLIEWWNSLEQRFSELESRVISQKESTADTHPFGRHGVAIPEIRGHQRGRRQRPIGKARKSSE